MRDVLARLARLEDGLKEKPKTRFGFIKDPTTVLAICAFIVSVVTTVYSWRKDEIENHESARREFNSTMQQNVDIGLKFYEFQTKNPNQANYSMIDAWSLVESKLLQDKAIQQLASIKDPSMNDYINVANIIVTGQPTRAATLYNKAIEIGQQKKKDDNRLLHIYIEKIESKLFGDKLDVSLSQEQREHDLADAYLGLGRIQFQLRKNEDAENTFETALKLFQDSTVYTGIARNFEIANLYKFWAEAEAASVDCNLALQHIKKAAEYYPEESKTAYPLYWAQIQYDLSYATSCGSDGKFHPPEISASGSFGTTGTGDGSPSWQSSTSSSNYGATWPDPKSTDRLK